VYGLTDVAIHSPGTWNTVVRGDVVPSPSWPFPFAPQHQSVRSSRVAQACWPSAASAVQRVPEPAVTSPMVWDGVAPSPRRDQYPGPQQWRVPPVFSAQRKSFPGPARAQSASLPTWTGVAVL
jgi:hypothetical protein